MDRKEAQEPSPCLLFWPDFRTRLEQPFVFFFHDAVGPWVVLEMAYHPAEVHGITRCGCLGMVQFPRDGDVAIMFHTVGFWSDHCAAKALWFIKPIIINLRLIMMVRRKTGPAARIGYDLSNN